MKSWIEITFPFKPTSLATASAVLRLSPVNIIGFIPRFLSSSRAFFESDLTLSRKMNIPANLSLIRTATERPAVKSIFLASLSAFLSIKESCLKEPNLIL